MITKSTHCNTTHSPLQYDYNTNTIAMKIIKRQLDYRSLYIYGKFDGAEMHIDILDEMRDAIRFHLDSILKLYS